MKISLTLRSARLGAAAAAAFAALVVAGHPQPAAAQSPDAADLCTPDVMRLCSEFVPDADRIVACLKAKRRQLSPRCLQALQPTKPSKSKRRTRSSHRN